MRYSPTREPLGVQESEALAMKISPILERTLRPILEQALRPQASMAEKYAAIGLVIQAWHSGYLHAGSGHPLIQQANELWDLLDDDRSWKNQFARTPVQRRMWKSVGDVLQGMMDGDSPIVLAMFDHLEPRA